MALSRVIRVGDGSTVQFTLDFALGYIQEDDVTCRVGDEVDGLGDPVYRNITFLSETLVEIDGAAPGVGVQVVFDRTVEKEQKVVNFSDGDVMDEINLDISFDQILMAVHEVLDGRIASLNNDLDLGGFQLKNVGEPIDDQDAATKSYVDGVIPTNEAILAQTIAAKDSATSSASAAASSAGAASSSASAAAGSSSSASTSASNAAASASSASTSASTASTQATNASNSASAAAASAAAALASQNAASTHETNAAASASSASGSASAASASASAAASSETNAATSETNAAGSASAAASSASAASTSETNAASSASSAASSEALAELWANEAVDVEVEPGLYSAYHWSVKALENASGPASGVQFTPAGNIASTNVQDAIEELDAEKAALSHSHAIADVTGLQTALDGKLSTSGKAADANLLDGLNSTQFVRSDASDTLSGSLTITGNLDVIGNISIGTSGGGDSWTFYHDDNTNTERSFGWDDSQNCFVAEENDNGIHRLALCDTQTSSTATNFPIGHIVMAQEITDVSRNASRTIRYATNGTMYYIGQSVTSNQGSVLTGTWRSRGTAIVSSNRWINFQRVA